MTKTGYAYSCHKLVSTVSLEGVQQPLVFTLRGQDFQLLGARIQAWGITLDQEESVNTASCMANCAK